MLKLNTMSERRALWHALLATRSAQEIEQGLLTLPENIRQVIQFYYLMKYPLKHIASRMSLSESTVRNHHNRGMFLLANYFAAEDDLISH